MRIAALAGPLEIGTDYLRQVPASKMDQATPPLLDPSLPHNIGDWFVTKIVDRVLSFEELIVVNKKAPASTWDVVNQTCDALILKGGNYIQPNWLTKNFGLEVFKNIKIPIVMFGVGLQASPGQSISFDDEEVEILKYIHANCATSAVRGYRTAEVLASIGIRNVTVTGCPTIFWSRKPRLSVRKPAAEQAGFSYRQGLYSSALEVYQAQFHAIEIVCNQFKSVKVILQGEEVSLQHLYQAQHWQAECGVTVHPMSESGARLLKRTPLDQQDLRTQIHKQLDRLSSPAFVEWMMDNVFFSYDIGEYLDEYKSKDIIVGCRLHSNLLALANETPAYFLTYDERTKEVVDLLGLPHSPLVEFTSDIDLLGQNWSEFEARYAGCYREMLSFLDANDLKHRLQGEDIEAHSRATAPSQTVELETSLPANRIEPTMPDGGQAPTGIYGQFWDLYVDRIWPANKERLHERDLQWPGDEWGLPQQWDRLFRDAFGVAGVDGWKNAVEIGPGSGKYTEKVLGVSNACVRAYDVSANFLEVCAQRCARWVEQDRLSLHLLRVARPDQMLTDLDAAGLRRRVDAFYSIDAMVHVDLQYLIVYLLTAALSLKPGGKLVLTLANVISNQGFEKLLKDVSWTYPAQASPHGSPKFEWLSPDIVNFLLSRLGFELDVIDTRSLRDMLVVSSLTNVSAAEKLASYLKTSTAATASASSPSVSNAG